MLGEETTEALNAWGGDLVKFAKIKIGDRNRRRTSKITGKSRRGAIENTRRLRNSFKFDLKEMPNSFNGEILAEDYAQDVNDGARRNANFGKLLSWVKSKPIRFRRNGQFIKTTPAMQKNFAKFVQWKVKNIGSDFSGYLDEAIEEANEKHRNNIEGAIFKDVEAATSAVLRGIKTAE